MRWNGPPAVTGGPFTGQKTGGDHANMAITVMIITRTRTHWDSFLVGAIGWTLHLNGCLPRWADASQEAPDPIVPNALLGGRLF
ncbi:hypothetical protein BA763_02110 [Burkholderia cenocepacia]|nr:hypothetical protein BA763_02110 [Burkholderia cenocepacia]